MRFLLGVEEGLFLARLGVALGVLDDAEGLFFGAADGLSRDAPAVGDPHGVDGRGRHDRDDQVDQ